MDVDKGLAAADLSEPLHRLAAWLSPDKITSIRALAKLSKACSSCLCLRYRQHHGVGGEGEESARLLGL